MDTNGSFNTLGSYNNVGITYDNFSLSQSSSVTGLTWQGAFSTGGFNQNPHDTINDFVIDFWADNSGQPGSLLQSETIPGNANETFRAFSNGTFFGGAPASFNIYNYSLALPTTFSAAAGTTYWVSIVAETPHNDPGWSWNSGVNGDGTSYQDFGSRILRTPDRAFTLQGTTVPEPGVVALVVSLGLSGAALLRRRRAR